MSKKYKLVGVSGTFSPPLHVGHEALIMKAFEVSERVMIGITIDEMTKHKTLASKIPPFNVRKQNVIDFLTKHDLLDRVFFIELRDAYGPSIEDKGLEAIIVSEDTYGAASDAALFRELDVVQVKGKSQGIRIYEVFPPQVQLADVQSKIEAFYQGRTQMAQRQFAESVKTFSDLEAAWPEDGPTKFFRQRCEAYAAQPERFDVEYAGGAYIFDVK